MKRSDKMMKKVCLLIAVFCLPTSFSYAQDKQEVIVFADNLEKCTPFKSEFTHPFNGQKMQREIVGIVEGTCLYIEEMPNKGKMTCRYDIGQLPVIAKYYRDVALAKTHSTSAKITSHGDSQEEKTTYTINGKDVKNPMQECMKNGDCVISGY
jgi:hypothetical protein